MIKYLLTVICLLVSTILASDKITLVIIGAGPAGLAAAQYAANDGINTIVFTGPLLGGLITQTPEVENYPGIQRIKSDELTKVLVEQAKESGAQLREETVTAIDSSSYPFIITTESGKAQKAHAIIYAMGATPKKLGVPEEETYVGRGISPCATCDARFFKGKDVAVVGGGNSAIEEALQLAHHVKSVTIYVRGDRMRAGQHNQRKIQTSKKINVIFNKQVVGVQGNGKKLTALEVKDTQTNVTRAVPMDGLFLAIGHMPNTSLLTTSVPLADDGTILIDERTRMTAIPGMFAAGDVADSRYRQAVTAAAQGVQAAMNVRWWFMQEGLFGS